MTMQETVEVAPNNFCIPGMIQQVSGSWIVTSIKLRNTTGYDLTKSQCNDGEVVAAQTQGGSTQDEAKHSGDSGRDPDHNPEIDVDIMKGRGKDAGGIGPDGKEGGITQVEQAGITHHDVQAHAQDHEDQCKNYLGHPTQSCKIIDEGERNNDHCQHDQFSDLSCFSDRP